LRGCSLDYQPADWHRVRVKRQIWRIALILLLPEWFDHFRTRRVWFRLGYQNISSFQTVSRRRTCAWNTVLIWAFSRRP